MCKYDRILIYKANLEIPDLISRLLFALQEIFQVHCEERGDVAIPPASYSRARNQFHAGVILDELSALRERDKDIVLCLTGVDLFVPELNFVFGVASSLSGCALVSVARLSNSFYGLPEDDEMFFTRVVTEAVHEIGHVLGLSHCSNPNCVMYFSNSLSDTDKKGYKFCSKCQKIAKKVLCQKGQN